MEDAQNVFKDIMFQAVNANLSQSYVNPTIK